MGYHISQTRHSPVPDRCSEATATLRKAANPLPSFTGQCILNNILIPTAMVPEQGQLAEVRRRRYVISDVCRSTIPKSPVAPAAAQTFGLPRFNLRTMP